MASAAKKAVRTRVARRDLEDRYGHTTRWVLSDLVRGLSDDAICDMNGITQQTLAAYKANLTRGTYDWALSRCNF